MSLVKKLIGAFVESPQPIHPLASIVEAELKSVRKVKEFLESLPERPGIDSVHVVSVTETTALCQCRTRVKDHENPRFFDAEVTFQVDLKSGACSIVTPP